MFKTVVLFTIFTVVLAVVGTGCVTTGNMTTAPIQPVAVEQPQVDLHSAVNGCPEDRKLVIDDELEVIVPAGKTEYFRLKAGMHRVDFYWMQNGNFQFYSSWNMQATDGEELFVNMLPANR